MVTGDSDRSELLSIFKDVEIFCSGTDNNLTSNIKDEITFTSW